MQKKAVLLFGLDGGSNSSKGKRQTLCRASPGKNYFVLVLRTAERTT